MVQTYKNLKFSDKNPPLISLSPTAFSISPSGIGIIVLFVFNLKSFAASNGKICVKIYFTY